MKPKDVVLFVLVTFLLGLMSFYDPQRIQAQTFEVGTVHLVNSTGDSPDDDLDDGVCETGNMLPGDVPECTLRAAIEQSEWEEQGARTRDTIEFNIPTSDSGFDSEMEVFTIAPQSPLPEIGNPIIIDGYTQPGAVQNSLIKGNIAILKIEMEGSAFEGQDVSGLFVFAGDSEIRGLAINRFGRSGIFLSLGGRNVIEGNFLGTDASGTVDLGNVGQGIEILNSAGNVIGGTEPQSRNLISGNDSNGVVIANGGSIGNVVEGNFIGTDKTGKNRLPNRLDGVLITHQIGTSDNPTCNVIGPGTVTSFSACQITPPSGIAGRNLISGNDYAGIEIYAGSKNVVQGNIIGLDVTGEERVPNEKEGVLILNEDAFENTLGGVATEAANVISGNSAHGITMERGTNTNMVLNNYIGTDEVGLCDLDAQGLCPLSNQGNGVVILDSAENVIGGMTSAHANIISGNGNSENFGDGILIHGKSARGNKILGNLIGTNASGISAIPNTANGIEIRGPQNYVGNKDSLMPVVLSGNKLSGIYINSSNAAKFEGNTQGDGNLVVNTYIGTSLNGLFPLHNDRGGVSIGEGAKENIIGGISFDERNVISGNKGWGVLLGDASTEDNKVIGNYIGTTLLGDAPLGNERGVAIITEASENFIGGKDAGEGNVISANAKEGVLISDVGTLDNKVLGNHIGTDPDGKCLLFINEVCTHGNGDYGVRIKDEATDNLIGGADAGEENVIAFNGGNLGKKGHGVQIESGKSNAIRRNSIFANVGRAINLVTPDTEVNKEYAFTVNDHHDGDDGPNSLQNYPVLTKIEFVMGQLQTEWALYSTPNSDFTVDFYSNDELDRSGFGEGETFLRSQQVRTNSKGVVTFDHTFDRATERFISATATDDQGNTSEFSMVDTDGDAIADAWETSVPGMGGIDVNEDGTLDYELGLFAEPDHKDIFVEIDAMETRLPGPDALANIEDGRPDGSGSNRDEGFANAPLELVQNPDAVKGIELHLELDETDIATQPWSAGGWPEFNALKRARFGSPDDRNNPNKDLVLAAKRLVYRYAVFADQRTGNGSSGRAEIGGNDFFVTLGSWGPAGGTQDQQSGTLMHELGHTLGLLHGGGQNTNCKPNYHSVMSYNWQTPKFNLNYSASWILDYSRSEFNPIAEGSIKEADGFGGHAGHLVPIGPAQNASGTPIPASLVAESGPLELNNSVPPNLNEAVSRDVNFVRSACGGQGLSTLEPHEDWSKLKYYFIASPDFRDGSHETSTSLEDEITQEADESFDAIGEGMGVLRFSRAVYEELENVGVAAIRVTRAGGEDGAVTVDYATSDGTATEGDDYTGVSGTLTFEEAEYSKTFEIPLVLDDEEEGEEIIQLTLSNPTGGATLGDRSEAELRINETSGTGVVQFSEFFFEGNEADGVVEVFMTRTGGLEGSVSVSLEVTGGTATAGSDYTSPAGNILFAEGESNKTVPITLIDDSVTENLELAMLALSDPAGVTIGNMRWAHVDIEDDDPFSNTFVVTNTNDEGPGSLRQAMTNANLQANHDLIIFNIPGDGVHTIIPLSPLPVITNPVTIDGYTQPGASPNTLTEGNNAVLLIEIDGTLAAGPVPPPPISQPEVRGIVIDADNSAVRGLIINRFNRVGIQVNDVLSSVIEGNFIGTDSTGTENLPNGVYHTPGNFPIGYPGIDVRGINTRIGGVDPASRNLISGNAGHGIEEEAVGTVVLGNYIGTQRGGLNPLGNGNFPNHLQAFGGGIQTNGDDILIGGLVPGAGNIIAFNNREGINNRLSLEGKRRFLSNSIHSSRFLGIGIGSGLAVVSVNDIDDLDTIVNYPILTSAASSDGKTVVEGYVSTRPNEEILIQFFHSDEVDHSGFGEGQTLIGWTIVTTDSEGEASFIVTLPLAFPDGALITSTATDSERGTSQFSARIAVNDVLGSSYTVNSNDDFDDGVCDAEHCNLREALHATNNHPGKDFVSFSIDSGVQTIRPRMVLPSLIEPVVIDGTTQTGFEGAPIIELSGKFKQLLTRNFQVCPCALHMLGGDSVVRGLVINEWYDPNLPPSFISSQYKGIQLERNGNNVVEGNYIGTDVTGTVAIGNFKGIQVVSSGNRIGGTTPEDRNLISGNVYYGVDVSRRLAGDTPGSDNQIMGNYIGTDVTGTTALGNGSGVYVTNGTNNTVGGSEPGAGNVISGNLDDGTGAQCSATHGFAVFIVGAENKVQGNLIGTDYTGTLPLGNAGDSVIANGGIIGGSRPGARNVIAAGEQSGVCARGDVIVQGNYIGTDITGTKALGNEDSGISVRGANNVIGGSEIGEGNLISGNLGNGVSLLPESNDNLFEGNFIGTQADGVTPLGNGGNGVSIGPKPGFGGSSILDNTIGGLEEEEGNVIAFNGRHGISARDSNYVGTFFNNTFLSNSIHNNGGLGIDLLASGVDPAEGGVTFNDLDDSDTGPNDLQNFPVLDSAESSGGITKVAANLTSTPETDFTIQFFASPSADPSGHGEGAEPVRTVVITTNVFGRVSFEIFLEEVTVGHFLTATATDPFGSTSEFSQAVQVDELEPQEGGGYAGEALLDIVTVIANGSPVADPGGPYAASEGDTITVNAFNSFDPDGEIVLYEWDLDGDGEFDDATGLMADLFLGDSGVLPIGVRVTDDADLISTATTVANVANVAPVVEAGGDQVINEGDSISLDPASFSDAGVLDSHTASIKWGDSEIDSGAIDQDADTVSGSHTYHHSHNLTFTSTFGVEVCVTDDDGDTGCDTLAVTVNPVTFDDGADLEIVMRDSKDPISQGENVIYTILVFNDGPETATNVFVTDTLPPGVTFGGAFASPNGTCSVNGSSVTCQLGDVSPTGDAFPAVVGIAGLPTFGGTLTNEVSVTSATSDPDPNDNSYIETTTVLGDEPQADLGLTMSDAEDPVVVGDEVVYTLTVTNNGPQIALNVVVTDTLPEGVTFVSATSDQGDCLEAGGAVTCNLGNLNSGSKADINVVVTANSAGTLTNAVSAASESSDLDPSNDLASEETVVNGSSNTPPLAEAGGPYSVNEGDTITLDGSGSFDGDQTADTLGYEWDLDYDGTAFDVDATGVSPDFDASSLDGLDPRTVALRVTDSEGEIDISTAEVTIKNVTPTIESVSNDSPINEGDSAEISVSATDAAGASDPLAYLWDCDDDGAFDLGPQVGNKGECGFADNGNFTVRIRVSDDDGGEVATSTTIEVVNVPPGVSEITAPIEPVQVGAEVTASTDFTDAGIFDTHTAIFNWGDGSTSQGAVTEASGSGFALGTHAYTQAGVYRVSLTVADKDGDSGESIFEFVVVFDPEGGFATGGGWFDSPEGAYVAEPMLTGKANFGFVSKYKKGITIPTGETEFQFKAGDLNFHSSSYQWLVVAGPRAQFKGDGTINGIGNFGFMLTAIDGQVNGGGGIDKFRIKIWDKDNGDAVVYDNQLGDDDDAELTTELGGGSIVIHDN